MSPRTVTVMLAGGDTRRPSTDPRRPAADDLERTRTPPARYMRRVHARHSLCTWQDAGYPAQNRRCLLYGNG